MDAILVESLCRLAPHRWAEAITRHEAVDAYLELGDDSVQAVHDCASKIGVDQRTFYRMIAARRKGPARRGRPRRLKNEISRVAPSRALLAGELEEIITLALQSVARPCQLADVQAEVLRLSRERKVSPPARGTVRARFRDVSNIPFPCDRDSSWILDSCTLAVDLKGPGGAIAPAVLVALVGSSSRQIVMHRVFCGRPGLRDIDRLFRDGDLADSRSSAPDSIVASAAFKHQAGPLAELLRQRAITLTTAKLARRGAANIMIGGEAIRNVVGSRLGKIPIRTRIPRGVQPDTVITLEAAGAVVARLVDHLNASKA